MYHSNPLRLSPRTCALLRAATLPSIQRSRSALRASVVPSAFLMLPLWRPHSFSVCHTKSLRVRGLVLATCYQLQVP